MSSLLRKSIFLAVSILLASAGALAQSKPEHLFSPPEWIWGEWDNLGGTEPNKIEHITFSEHEIELVQNQADPPFKFSSKFRKHQVQETFAAETYRIVVSNSKEEMVWEFKLCPLDKCNLMTGQALSFYAEKNKKKLWDHSTSLKKVLIRNSRKASTGEPASKMLGNNFLAN